MVPTPDAASVLAASPDAVLTIGPDGRVLSANASAGQLLGRDPAKLPGARFLDFLPKAERARVEGLQREAMAGAPQRYDTRLAVSGDERVVSVAAAPAPSANGAPRSLILALRDVTEERLAHEVLARSESRYRHLFEGARDAIMTFDALGRFTTINDAGELISGYSREELIGRFFGPLIPLEELPKTVSEFRRALSGQSGQFDTAIIRKGGERRYITVTYSCPQRSKEVLCLIRDATEEKQLQQQLIQSEKMAAIGQLVSGVAHELNNPLASISAFAQLLLADRGISADQRHSVDVIASEAKRAARIVHNLLTFARQHKAEKTYSDVNKVIEDTLELRAYELNVRGVKLVRDLDRTPPETMVDVYQLQQVLLNLLTNAVQAMAEVERAQHRLVVRTRTHPDTIRIEVEDTGPGIPPESLERIFNPFYTTKPTGSGTGLGLSISLGIVGEHGGRIWAENVAGGGSRFCIELPRAAAAPERMPEAPKPVATPVPGLRILVADDEAPIRLALERFLSAEGHQVCHVSSGSDALDRASKEPFDVILLDMRMPDVSGQQIFERWARERPDLTSRVIFITGDIVSADLQRFLTDTGRPFLAKPFDFEAILRVLPQQQSSAA
jgi:two-component system NtrC family sensor kinase